MASFVSDQQIWTAPTRNIKIDYSTSSRSATSVSVSFTVTYTFTSTSSSAWQGYSQYFSFGGNTYTLKENSPTNWYGSPIVKTFTGTVSGLSSTSTSASVTVTLSSADPDDADKTFTGTISFSSYAVIPGAPTSVSGKSNVSSSTSAFYIGYNPDSNIALSASGGSSASYYQFQVSVNGGTWTSVSSPYTPSTKTNGTTYTFRARSVSSTGDTSGYTNGNTLTAQYRPSTKPDSVTLTSGKGSTTEIRLGYQKDTGLIPSYTAKDINISFISYEYRKNSGSWTAWPITPSTILDSLAAGDKVQIRGRIYGLNGSYTDYTTGNTLTVKKYLPATPTNFSAKTDVGESESIYEIGKDSKILLSANVASDCNVVYKVKTNTNAEVDADSQFLPEMEKNGITHQFFAYAKEKTSNTYSAPVASGLFLQKAPRPQKIPNWTGCRPWIKQDSSWSKGVKIFVKNSADLWKKAQISFKHMKENPFYLKALEDGEFSFYATPYNGRFPNLYYCINDGKQVKINYETNTIQVKAGDKIFFEGDGNTTLQSSYFEIKNCLMEAHGNIFYLLNQNGTQPQDIKNSAFYQLFKNCSTLKSAKNLFSADPILSEYCYANTFEGCTSLEEAPELPSMNLNKSCYTEMFKGCSSLQTAPELPATRIPYAAYSSMFEGCSSLTKAPALPGTILEVRTSYGVEFGSNYGGMFKDCTNLTDISAISILPIQELADTCYFSMFENCTSLTTAPILPATVMKASCYNSMFAGCTSLITAPELPATTLDSSCYACMFENCTALQEAPILSSTTLAEGCYREMFSGCVNLREIPLLPATSLPKDCYYSMFKDCQSLTSILTLPIFDYIGEKACQAMFKGCNNLINIQDIEGNSGTIYTYGLSEMFANCIALSRLPNLINFTNVHSYGCKSMFENCSNVKVSTQQSSEYTIPWKCSITNPRDFWNSYLIRGTTGTYTGTISPNTTYYLHVENLPWDYPVQTGDLLSVKQTETAEQEDSNLTIS